MRQHVRSSSPERIPGASRHPCVRMRGVAPFWFAKASSSCNTGICEQLNAKRQRRRDAKGARIQNRAVARPNNRHSMTENQISRIVVDAAIEVHRTLKGPGLLESVYEEALVFELRCRGLHVQRQIEFPLMYKGSPLARKLRIDVLVNNSVIVECKASEKYNSVFEIQALTYLRLRNLRLALLINFGQRLVKNGIHRVVNQLDDS